MAIVFLQQRKSQKKLILLFIGILLVTATVIWQGFFKKEEITPPRDYSTIPQEVKINLDVLKTPFIQKLQLFPEIKRFQETIPAEGVEVGQKLGRENPFLPY